MKALCTYIDNAKVLDPFSLKIAFFCLEKNSSKNYWVKRFGKPAFKVRKQKLFLRTVYEHALSLTARSYLCQFLWNCMGFTDCQS